MQYVTRLTLTLLVTTGSGIASCEEDREPKPYVTTAYPVVLLSANDGEMRFVHTADGLRQKPVNDSITVIRLRPNHPPVSTTVSGRVPVSIFGSPHVVVSANGRYGFISNHRWRELSLTGAEHVDVPPEQLGNVLTAVDLTTNSLSVIDQVELTTVPWMVDLHPDGCSVIVSVGSEFRIYSVDNRRLALKSQAKAPGGVRSFDVSPRGDYLIAVTQDPKVKTRSELHLFGIDGNTIKHHQRVLPLEGIGRMDQLFSPRISPDGKTAIVLNDLGIGGKGTLDDILIVDLDRDVAAVTARVSQVGDGLESLAFHPSGDFAVVCCLEAGLDGTSVSHLAVIDLKSQPARVLSYYPVELIPEGIEFTADGSKLFVGTTTAHHIVVFDVDGQSLKRNPMVLRTGHGPAALAIGTWTESFLSKAVEIAYVDTAGEGDPVVLIHGGFSSLDGWLSGQVYKEGTSLYKELIRAGFRVIAMDCRGHGRSGKPHDPRFYGVELADDVARLLDHLKIARAHVVGYSMGGDIANKFRERHSDRLTTVTMGGAGRNPTDGWSTVDFDITQIAESLECGNGITEYLRLPMTIGEEGLSKKEAEEANKYFMNGNDPLAMAAMIRGYADLTVSTESLKNNAVPTLVIVGEFDAERPDAEKLKGLMSRIKFVIIPGQDHLTTFLQPEFSRRILHFLKSHCGKRKQDDGWNVGGGPAAVREVSENW